MTTINWLLRFALIWVLSRLAAPRVSRVFNRLARRVPSGSFLEGMLLELSTTYSAEVVRVIAETLTTAILESSAYAIKLAQALRVRPAPSRFP